MGMALTEKAAAEKAAVEKASAEKADASASKDTAREDSVKTISKDSYAAQNQNLEFHTEEQKLNASASLKKSQSVQQASKQGENENSSKDSITSPTLQRDN